MSQTKRRVGVLGIGNVGIAAVSALTHQQLVDEILVYDCDTDRAEGEVLDFMDGIEVTQTATQVKLVSLTDLASCDMILVAYTERATALEEDRLMLLEGSATIARSVIPKLKEAGFLGKYVIATNPCDIITYLIWQLSGLPRAYVIGTGTALDSMRLRRQLSQQLAGVNPSSIQAFMIGEHGNSQFACFSHVRIGGLALADYETLLGQTVERLALEKKVVYFGFDIFERKGHTQFGIGNVLAAFVQAIYNDAKIITAAAAVLDGEYGVTKMAMGVPVLLGAGGIERIIPLTFDSRETIALDKTVAVIRANIMKLN
ncbi:lactate/malate family dehydrogenase [Brochothrix campestris]